MQPINNNNYSNNYSDENWYEDSKEEWANNPQANDWSNITDEEDWYESSMKEDDASKTWDTEPVRDVAQDNYKNPLLINRNDSSDRNLRAALETGNGIHNLESFFQNNEPNLLSHDVHGNTPLHLAALNGDLEACIFLLHKGKGNLTSFSYHNNSGLTPLHSAVLSGNLEVVEYMLSIKESAFNIKDHFGRTPVVLAYLKEKKEIVELFNENFKIGFEEYDASLKNLNDFSKLLAIAHTQQDYIKCSKLALGACSIITAFIDNEYYNIKNLLDQINSNIKLINSTIKTINNEHELLNSFLKNNFYCDAQKLVIKEIINGIDKLNRKISNISYIKNLRFLFAIKSKNIQHIEEIIKDSEYDLSIKDPEGNNPLHLLAKDVLLSHHIKTLSSDPQFRSASLEKNAKDLLPIHLASISGNLLAFTALLEASEKDMSVNHFRDNFNRTPLHYAAQNKHLEICRHFLQCKPFAVQIRDNEGRSAIHYAAQAGDLQTVKLLIEELFKGVNEDVMNTKRDTKDSVWMALDDDKGVTPIHLAAEAGHADVCEFLMKHRYTSRLMNFSTIKGDAVISYAVMGGHYSLFNISMRSRNDYFQVNKAGETLFHLAVKAKKVELFKVMFGFYQQNDVLEEINYLYKQDSNGHTILHTAVLNGSFEVCKEILQSRKSMLYVKDNQGQSTIHYAAKAGNLKLVELLTEKLFENVDDSVFEIDRETPTPINVWKTLDDNVGVTPLHLAAEAGYADICHFFINHRYASHLNTFVSKNKDSSISYAVMGGQINILKRFIPTLDELHVVNNKGETLLHLAAKSGKNEMFEYLLQIHKNCKKSNCQNEFRYSLLKDLDGRTILHIAAQNKNLELCKLILQHESRLLLKKDKNGRSAIHYAAEAGDLNIVKLLVEELLKDIMNEELYRNKMLAVDGIWLALEDQEKLTPIHLAAKAGHIEICQFFLHHPFISRLKGYVDSCGNSILGYAAMSGNVNLLKMIIEITSESINIVNKQGETLLHLALKEDVYPVNEKDVNLLLLLKKNNKSEMIEYLLANCKDLLIQENATKRTILHLAAQNRNYNACTLILRHQPQLLRLRDFQERSAIHYAAQSGSLEIVRMFIYNLFYIMYEGPKESLLQIERNTADSVWMTLDDSEGLTPLHLAAEAGHIDICQFIKDHPFASRLINFPTKKGDLVLSYAVRGGHINIINMFYYADLKHHVNNIGETLLHIALKAKKLEVFEQLEKVNENSEYSLLQDLKGETVLHLAAQEGYTKLVESLIKNDKEKRLGGYRNNEGLSARQVGRHSKEASKLLDLYQPNLQEARDALQVLEMSLLGVLGYLKDKAPQSTFLQHFKVIKAKTQLIAEASNGQQGINDQIQQKIANIYEEAKRCHQLIKNDLDVNVEKIEEMAKEVAMIRNELQPPTVKPSLENVNINNPYVIDGGYLSSKIDLSARRFFERDPQLVFNLRETVKGIQKGDFSSEIEDLFSEISHEVVSQPPLLSLVLLHVLQTQLKIQYANAPEIFKKVKQFSNISSLTDEQKKILQDKEVCKRFALYIINSFSKQESFKFDKSEKILFEDFKEIIVSVVKNAEINQIEFGAISRCFMPIFSRAFEPEESSQAIQFHINADSHFQAELFVDEIPEGELKNKAIDDILKTYLSSEKWVWVEAFINSFIVKMPVESRRAIITKYFVDLFTYANGQRKAGREVPLKHLKSTWNQLNNDLHKKKRSKFSSKFISPLGEDAVQFFKEVIKGDK